jgi:hypothetical protein
MRAIPNIKAVKLIIFLENLLVSLSFIYYRVVAHSCSAVIPSFNFAFWANSAKRTVKSALTSRLFPQLIPPQKPGISDRQSEMPHLSFPLR